MWLAVTVYTDGMGMGYGKFKTKKAAVEYLEELGYEESGRWGRKVKFHAYASYAEVIPMDRIGIDETN